MRPVLALLLCAGLLAQDGPGSRPFIANDWCRVEFRPDLRPRALEIMTAMAPARARVIEKIGLDPKGAPLTIVVVRDADGMRSEVVARTGSDPPDWAGGLALPELNLVVIRADLQGEPFDRVDSVVTHELVHIAFARARPPESAAAVPRWFEEGVAQWVAGRARPFDVPDLRPAAAFGYLLQLPELNAAFARGEGAAARAYAEAESFVRFVAQRSGSPAIRQVVELVLNGADLDTAFSMTTAAGLNTLWAAWQRDLAADRGWVIEAASRAVVAILILIVVALGVRRVLRRKHAIESRWEKEEGYERSGSEGEAG